MKIQRSRQLTFFVAMVLHYAFSSGIFVSGFQTTSHLLRTPHLLESTKLNSKLNSLVKERESQKLNITSLLIPENFEDGIASEEKIDDVQKFVVDDTVYIMMALIFAIGSLSALDRVAMSVALVPMSEELGYTDTTKGSISSLFSVGYGLGIVPSGLMLASFSPRLIMAAGIGLWSAGTLATPFAAAQANMAFLLSARVLVGASESVVIPTIQRLLSTWVPADKKGLAVATVFAGFQTGTVLAYSLTPVAIDATGDWRSIFFM